MSAKTTVNRRRLFIDPQFQMLFILKYVLLVVAGTVLFSLAAFFILDKQIGESLFSAHLAIRRTGELLKPTLIYLSAAVAVILGVASVFITLLVSHKISGPLYALSRYLKLLSEGKLNFTPKLRTNDQTATLAEELGETIKSLRGKMVMLKNDVQGLRKDLESLGSQLGQGGKDPAASVRLLNDMNERVRVLEDRLAHFETE